MWLFSYNKENFGYDAGMRFGRFMTARGFANSQVEQYREDIEGITGMTTSKMDAWQTVTTLFLAVGAALSCAGRIGMHGCAPPGWFCALFSGSIFASVLFNGLSLWLSMHASLRAQCASVSLLTRKVRLPIPNMAQLDQARVFGSAFETQEYRDIFRVPFMRHPEAAPSATAASEGEKKGEKAKSGKAKVAKGGAPQEEFGSTARDTVPSWIRDEHAVDKINGFTQAEIDELHEEDEAPQHFALLMEAQKEWRDYDVYARITMLYGTLAFLHAVTYYAIGTAIAELRGFWVMWSLPFVFVAAQALVLRLETFQTERNNKLPNCEYLGYLAPFLACAACTIEYRYYYSQAQVAVAWGLALSALFGHLMFALRLLDLAWPSNDPLGDMPEEPAKQWWPASWAVPRAFAKNLWMITPPKQLQTGQSCLLHEMENLAAAGGGKKSPTKKSSAPAAGPTAPIPTLEFGVARTHDLPWHLTRLAILSVAFQWLFMMVATGVEVVMGPESLMKPPGEPPWIRDIKGRMWAPESVHTSRSGALPEDYRLFAASTAHYTEGGDTSAGHRRLGSDSPVDDLIKAVPELTELLEKLAGARAEAGDQTAPPSDEVPGGFMAPEMKVQEIAWPPLFEPHHLAHQPGSGHLAALTRRGFGALAPVGGGNAEPFAFDGVAEHGPIVGAAWLREGLLLASRAGAILRCAGEGPAEGVWACAEAQRLPMPKDAALSAAGLSDGQVALLFEHMPHSAVLYKVAPEGWSPSGEVHIPPHIAGDVAGMTFAGPDVLLIAGRGGEVHRRHLAGGPAMFHEAPAGATGAFDFRAACAAGNGGLLRLALRRSSGPSGAAWAPQLVATEA